MAVMKNPSLLQKVADTGSAPAILNTAAFDDLLRQDGAKWGQMMREQGLVQLKT
jgi:tripartite-type tricarboxylate transporter receptor subunit TctC